MKYVEKVDFKYSQYKNKNRQNPAQKTKTDRPKKKEKISPNRLNYEVGQMHFSLTMHTHAVSLFKKPAAVIL